MDKVLGPNGSAATIEDPERFRLYRRQEVEGKMRALANKFAAAIAVRLMEATGGNETTSTIVLNKILSDVLGKNAAHVRVEARPVQKEETKM